MRSLQCDPWLSLDTSASNRNQADRWLVENTGKNYTSLAIIKGDTGSSTRRIFSATVLRNMTSTPNVTEFVFASTQGLGKDSVATPQGHAPFISAATDFEIR